MLTIYNRISAVDTLLVINALREKYKGTLTFVGLGHSFGAAVLMIAEVLFDMLRLCF